MKEEERKGEREDERGGERTQSLTKGGDLQKLLRDGSARIRMHALAVCNLHAHFQAPSAFPRRLQWGGVMEEDQPGRWASW